jgi:predicted Zn-dependent peptidase
VASFPATPPPLGAAPALRIPPIVTRTLGNGMKVMYVSMPELPVVSATLVDRGGISDDPASAPGLAAFTASMLDEGAAGRTSLQIADALDLLGASLSANATWDASQVNLYVLRKNFPAALGIMADVVTRPDFPQREVQRVRDERLVNLQRGRDEPTVIAGNAFQALVFGQANPYGRFATVSGTRGMSRAQLVSFHRSYYRPDQATLILVGDVDPNAIHADVERTFGGWRSASTAPIPAPAAPVAANTPATRIFLIDKPGAAQSEIRIGHPGVARTSPDYFPLLVLNSMLGGAFTSRLNQNLREKHGYTYGASSGFSMRRGAGPFMARAAVKTAQTDSSLTEFFRELNRIRTETVPAAELAQAKSYVALGFPQSFETTGQVGSQIAGLVQYGIDPSFFGDYVARVNAVTPADVQRVANQYVRPANSVVVVVGDRRVIEPGIRALNLAPVEIRSVSEFVK